MNSVSYTFYTAQKKKLAAQQSRKAKFVDFKDLVKVSNKLKKKNQKIVFTTGTFDLLNPGHCRYLAEARSRGDVLVVGVSPDYSVRQAKGDLYPLINQDLRAELVSYLKTVDYVTFCPEGQPHGVLALLKPDVFFTSAGAWDDGLRDMQEEYLVKSYGGVVVRRKRHSPYLSTVQLVEHIANIRVLQILENYIKQEVKSFQLNPDEHLHPADYSDQIPIYDNAFNPMDRVRNFSDIPELVKEFRSKKKTVVFVSGSYDLLHTGHARFIEKAGTLGDLLVVGIPSDRSLRVLKGVGRPVISETARAYVLSNLDLVNYVVVFDHTTILSTLQELKPDVFFTVDESWNSGLEDSPEYKTVVSYGGKVVKAERQSPFLSSSAIINKVAGEKVKEIFSDCMDDRKYENIIKERSKFQK